MNVFTASGNIGKDAAVRQVNDTSVTAFSVAVKSGYGQNEQTLWVDCSVWGRRGEALQAYLLKGQQVVVSGELSTREHNGKTYLQMRCNDVTLVGGKPKHQEEQPQGQPPSDNFDDAPFN